MVNKMIQQLTVKLNKRYKMNKKITTICKRKTNYELDLTMTQTILICSCMCIYQKNKIRRQKRSEVRVIELK